MRAAVLEQIGAPLRMMEVPDLIPSAGEVLVKTMTCGLCRTDLHLSDGIAYVPSLPHIMGHEPAGIVAAVGPGVSGVAIGQRVVPYLFITCGRCRFCRRGRDAQCAGGPEILGVTRPGAFAEYFLAPAANLIPLADNVDFAEGGLVSCAGVTALHAYRRSGLEAGQTALVLGAGGVGLMLTQILKDAGLRVVCVAGSESGRELAVRCGADLSLLKESPIARKVLDFTGGEGAASAFDCVGTAATMAACAASIDRGGRIVVVGEEAEFPRVDTIAIAQRELEIVGTRNGSKQDARDAVEMMGAGILRPPIARRFALDEINDALDCLRAGDAPGRIVVEMNA